MSPRRATMLVAGREIGERARSRAFRVSVAVQLLIVLAVVVISALSGGDDTTTYDVAFVGEPATAVEAAMKSGLPPGTEIKSEEPAPSESEARAQVESGDLDGAVVGERLIVAPDNDELNALVQNALTRASIIQKLRAAGLSQAETGEALKPPNLEVDEVNRDEESAKGIAFVGTLLLYIGILGFGYLVTSAIVEEKTSRVVELVLSTIRPAQLLAGKVIGIGLLGLGQLLLTAIVGLGAALISGQIDLPSSTPQTVGLVLVYFMLGYALYSCAFAVAGAIVSRQEDVGSVTTPLTIILVAAYIASFSIVDDPSGTLATVCTYLPPVAPLIVPARAAVDGLPTGELMISIALMLLAIAGLIWLAARIYERAVLRVGAPLKLSEGLRLARGNTDASR